MLELGRTQKVQAREKGVLSRGKKAGKQDELSVSETVRPTACPHKWLRISWLRQNVFMADCNLYLTSFTDHAFVIIHGLGDYFVHNLMQTRMLSPVISIVAKTLFTEDSMLNRVPRTHIKFTNVCSSYCFSPHWDC